MFTLCYQEAVHLYGYYMPAEKAASLCLIAHPPNPLQKETNKKASVFASP